MKNQKLLNLVDEASDSKFVIRTWSIVNKQSNAKYNAANKINYNVQVLKSIFCDFNDAYILVKGDIATVASPETQVVFKN